MPQIDLPHLETVGREVAELAGQELLRRFGAPAMPLYAKDRPVDVVGEADLAAERLIASCLAERRPDDGLLTEEIGSRAGTSGLRWIVDPLDGTINFLRGIPHWAVSIACESQGHLIIGVVHDPLRGETFAVARGGAPTLNGVALSRPGPSPLSTAVLTGSIGHSRTPDLDRQGQLASALHGAFGQLRVLGSAALDLAWTAAGRCDAFYHEEWAKLWDIAAGVLLCEAAGLQVVQLEPAMPQLSNRVLAAPAPLMAELRRLVERV